MTSNERVRKQLRIVFLAAERTEHVSVHVNSTVQEAHESPLFSSYDHDHIGDSQYTHTGTPCLNGMNESHG